MKTRTEILSAPPVAGRRITNAAGARLAWYRDNLVRRWDAIEDERAEIRRIVRRYNRRFRRQSGQGLKNA